jgi:hypothetical protein
MTARPPRPPRCPECAKQHACFYNLARCLYPRHAWISGEGPWALVSRCGRRADFTVTLHADKAEALGDKISIDETGCGSRCRGAHEVEYIGDELAEDAP